MIKGPAMGIRDGGSPRGLPDYQMLCQEMAKLGHSARPDVDWQFIERCCLSLFASNGADLQTAAAYALARSHLAGLDGMSEGVTVLETLLQPDSKPWPRGVKARAEILGHLFAQWQALLRELDLGTRALANLGRLNVQLEQFCLTLLDQNPVPINTVEGLRQQIAQRALRIEREAQAVTSLARHAGQHSPSQPPTQRNPASTYTTLKHKRPDKKKRRALWCGLLAAALLSLIAAWAWLSGVQVIAPHVYSQALRPLVCAHHLP